jgi:isoamylase
MQSPSAVIPAPHTHVITSGTSAPLGATVQSDGVNFSVFAKHAAAIELVLFADENATQPSRVIALDPSSHRTYHYWHVFVPDIGPGQVYGYRARGPFAPQRGLRFDGQKVLLDPYGLAVAVPRAYDRSAAS